MNKGNIKKIFAGVLVMALSLAGIIYMPSTVEAAADDVLYEKAVIGDYWTKTKKSVPLKEDYVFGGWYTTSDGITYEPIKEADITTDGAGKATNANTYAKFVPAYVLSIKMQIEAEAVSGEEEKTSLRILSAVDSLRYQSVGFDIWLGNRASAEATPTISKVYQKLKLSAADPDESAKLPEKEFGAAANYFSALRISDIGKNSFASRIYARPYWITMDGTKVEGLSKNVHVEDAFETNMYRSVPINLLSGEDVAAGMVTVKYDATKVEVVENKVEFGRLFTEMEYYVDTNAGTITFVGNADTSGTNIKADGLYANIRFKAKDITGDELGSLTFTEGKFCDWNENYISTVKVWDAKY